MNWLNISALFVDQTINNNFIILTCIDGWQHELFWFPFVGPPLVVTYRRCRTNEHEGDNGSARTRAPEGAFSPYRPAGCIIRPVHACAC